jgi:hypothetical protein
MTSALEEAKTIEVAEWLTLATAPSPTKLKAGQTPYAFNTWVDEKPGSVITANGFIKVGALPSGKSGTFCTNYFKTSAGTQTFVVSDNATVWTTVDFQTFTPIITGLSILFQLRGVVIRDKLWLTNGNDSVRIFDGSVVTVLDGTGGTPNVPKGRYITYHDERVWIGHISSGRSQCYFSALTDASANIIAPDNASAWPNANFLQVSEGDADFLTGLLLYRGYLHFFKQYSIWRLVGYDEYTYTRVKTRASTGTRFNESLQVLDSLVHMIGIDGIYVFDGEETERISDIIDPATAEQTAFGFNQLQQPNLNNLFWEVTSTSDFNAGTVPQNLAIANAATLHEKDTSQADFQAAPTLTNIDSTTTVDSIQMSRSSSGLSAPNIALNQPVTLTIGHGSKIGADSYATDGAFNNAVGVQGDNSTGSGFFVITLPSTLIVSRIILKGFIAGSNGNGGNLVEISISGFGTGIVPTVVNNGGVIGSSGGQPSITFPANASPTDTIIDLTPTSTSTIRIFMSTVGGASIQTLTEIQIFATAYNTTAQIVSRTLDLGDTPASLGNFFADFVANGETLTFQTQSSADGTTWDAAVAVTNGAAIGSTVRRYLRWIGNFTSDGLNTPVLADVWVGTLYESAIHDTGGTIFSWGAFESDYALNGQTIAFYYRGATISGGVLSASWNLIVPGGAINLPTTDRYIQFKFEISGFSSGTNPPVVTSVTMNWVTGTVGQTQVLQNVASVFWRNRYWLSAAGASATANNTILIRGKKTFGSPWQLRDWNILAFTRYLDNLYGTDSTGPNIYQLDTGYSKNGVALNSVFETGDFTFKGFQVNVVEMLVETERLGPYNLTVSTSTDQGLTWVDHTIDLTSDADEATSTWVQIRNLNLTTDKVRVRFLINGVDQPWQVHNLIVYYKPSMQRGTIVK